MASCPVRAEQVLESHGRPLRITLSRPSDCAKYEITLDVALHFGPEDHSCAEKLNKNNDQVGRETLQLFKSGLTNAGPPARFGVPGRSTHEQRGASSLSRCHTLFIQTTSAEAALGRSARPRRHPQMQLRADLDDCPDSRDELLAEVGQGIF